jgi:hypothetical protein
VRDLPSGRQQVQAVVALTMSAHLATAQAPTNDDSGNFIRILRNSLI